MSARPSWSFDDINPKVRERAEDSARRAGMSVGDWINATIGDATFGNSSLGKSPFDTREPVRETMTAQQRLDAIARQFDSGAARAAPKTAEPRSDARLSDYTESSASARNANPYGPRSSGAVSLEAAIAEISARQHELDTSKSRRARTSVPTAKLSTLERQISHIMTQMESMPNPGLIEQSIASFRADLADIRKTITEAMPRRAIETIESEVRTLSQRLDETRNRGVDANALANVEAGLDQIRGSLKTLMPAEQLAGFDDAIRNLAGQLDSVVRGGSDANVLNQLEEAIASLRVIVSNVASNEALATLGGDVRALAGKLDEFANSGGFGESIAALETRIVSLASFLQKRDAASAQHGDASDQVEAAIRELSERIQRSGDGVPTGYDARMSNLLDRLEAISNNPGIVRVEEGLLDIRRQLEERRAMLDTAGNAAARVTDPALVDSVKRELADIRLNLTASERHTLESLEVVNNTLGHVVDRLAMIEGDLRGEQVKPKMPSSPLAAAAAAIAQSAAAPRPEMPNPAAFQRPLQPAVESPPLQPRAALVPNLPPDTPLEPGSRSAGLIAEEIEAQADEKPEEGSSTSNFIAAARRAARAAAAAAPENEKTKGKAAKAKPESGESSLASKIRSLLVGASVVVIVVGSFRMAMNILDGAAPPSLEMPAASAPPGKQSAMMAPAPKAEIKTEKAEAKAEPVYSSVLASAGADITGSITQPPQGKADLAPSGSRISIPFGETLPETIGNAKLRDAALKGDAGAAFEIGARYAEARGVPANLTEAVKWYERASQAGIATGAFRLGAMYEKGMGVKKDLDLARRYYQQAADRGFAKAMHNLAVLDADGGPTGANFKSASLWFRKAAERGVVDSQYNLGILYARGIGVEQNLAESFKWFSLAAAQGDADSASKRDDVAKKIDPQSLAAAKLAIQTFTPEPQPAEATNLGIPPGGWDGQPQQAANTAKPAAQPKRVIPR